MATYTSNLNLKKPATTDMANIADINGNMDTLDTVVGNIGTVVSSEHSETGQVLNANNATIYVNNSITLTAGKWILIGAANISHAVAGSRQGFTVATSDTAGSYTASRYDLRYQAENVNNVNQYYNVHGIVNLTGSTTFYAMIYNGNIAFNCWTGLYAIRIR